MKFAFVLAFLLILALVPSQVYSRDWEAEQINHQQIKKWLRSFEPLAIDYEPSLGIEIEGRYPFPNDIDYSILGITSAEFVRSQKVDDYDLLIKEAQAVLQYRQYGQAHKIEFKNDPTVVPVNHFQNFEMNSAILRSEEDRMFFSRLVRDLSFKAELSPASASGGLHFHLGFENPRLEEVALFTFLFASVHDQLKAVFQVGSYREESYAKPYSPAEFKWLLAFLYANKDHLNYRLGHQTMIVSRARAINWQAFMKFNTVEIRLFNSSFNPVIINSASDFLLKLVKAIRTKSSGLVSYLNKTPPNKIELVGLASSLEADLADPKLRTRIRKIAQLELENDFSRNAGFEVKESIFACESVLFY